MGGPGQARGRAVQLVDLDASYLGAGGLPAGAAAARVAVVLPDVAGRAGTAPGTQRGDFPLGRDAPRHGARDLAAGQAPATAVAGI